MTLILEALCQYERGSRSYLESINLAQCGIGTMQPEFDMYHPILIEKLSSLALKEIILDHNVQKSSLSEMLQQIKEKEQAVAKQRRRHDVNRKKRSRHASSESDSDESEAGEAKRNGDGGKPSSKGAMRGSMGQMVTSRKGKANQTLSPPKNGPRKRVKAPRLTTTVPSGAQSARGTETSSDEAPIPGHTGLSGVEPGRTGRSIAM